MWGGPKSESEMQAKGSSQKKKHKQSLNTQMDMQLNL